MKLTLKEIEQITFGALKVEEANGEFVFHRFSEEQYSCYKEKYMSYYERSQATASVMLDLITDSELFEFDYRVAKVRDEYGYYFDVYENGVLIAHEGCADPTGGAGKISLKTHKGQKRLQVYFPMFGKATVSNITLDDGAFIKRPEKKLKALFLGDSITQGFLSEFASLTYVNTLIRELDLDAVNQGIGAAHFFHDLLGTETLTDADIIFIALGTNDWNSTVTYEKCKNDAESYMTQAKKLYGKKRVFYISPIWRSDINTERASGSFEEATALFCQIAEGLGFEVIDGLELTPHAEFFFKDSAHPNDLGFTQYANALINKLCKLGVTKP